MSDESYVPGGPGEADIPYEAPEIEFSDEAPNGEPTAAEMKALYESEKLKTASNAEILSALKSVSERPVVAQLEGWNPNAQQQQAQRPKTAEEIANDRRLLTERFYTDPLAVIDERAEELAQRKMAPAMQEIATSARAQNRTLTRLEPSSATLWPKYEGEIEAEAAKGPWDLNAYTKACDTVRNRHAGELAEEGLADKIKAGVAEALKAMGINPAAQGNTASRTFTETGGNYRPATATGGKITLPKAAQEELARLKTRMDDAQATDFILRKYGKK
jgi:hypothetical protein